MRTVCRARRPLGFLLLVCVLSLAACDVREGWIELRNDTSRSITLVSIEPCGAPIPGPNRLGTGRIPSGGSESFQVRFGCHDVVIMTEDGLPGGWRVDVSASQRRTILFAQDPPSGAAALGSGRGHP